jgi:hypothetical protein
MFTTIVHAARHKYVYIYLDTIILNCSSTVDEVGACMAFRDKYFIDLILTFFQIFLLASLGSKEDKAKT